MTAEQRAEAKKKAQKKWADKNREHLREYSRRWRAIQRIKLLKNGTETDEKHTNT